MLEILILVCAVAACIYTPIEAKKVHNGWVNARFKGTAEEFRAKYVKQLKTYTYIGFGLGILYAIIGGLSADNGAELVVKLVISAVWILLGIINLTMRKKYFEASPV
jgi:hypothetical protein